MFQFYSAPTGATKPEHPRNQILIQNGIYVMLNCVHGQLPVTKFAVDNGEWIFHTKNLRSDFSIFENYLEMLHTKGYEPEFIILPDAYGNGERTLELHEQYIYLADRFKSYLPLQDGLLPRHIKPYMLETIEGLFIGGSDAYKEKNIHEIVAFCRDNGLKCHVGRVGTLARMLFYNRAGVDSVDSSTFVRNNDFGRLLGYLKTVRDQQVLEDSLKQPIF